MKKIRIAFTLFAGCLFFLNGCQVEKEMDVDFTKPADDEIVFSSPVTRSAAVQPKGITTQIALGDEGKELGLVLEETVTRLGAVPGSAAITRGTPAYTENVDKIYGAFNAVVLDKDDNQKFGDGPFTYADNKWTRRFYQDPWEGMGTESLYFYMRMPATMDGIQTPESGEPFTYGLKNGKQTIEFEYLSPKTASAQKDILFAARPLSKAEYEEALANNTYPDVLFHHALTGVKFANYFPNPDDNTKTVIKKVTFKGLIDEGICVVTPRKETNGYVDDKTGDYSSGDGSTVVWSDTTRTGVVMSQEYPAAFAEYNSQKLPEAFTGENADQNLNDADATGTFWIIPQKLTANTTVEVEFQLEYVQSRAPQKCTLTLNLGQLLKEKNIEWKAGELRTYTLKPTIVDVEITDSMDVYKYKKSDVVIENTGNVDQYVRVYMIGNWVGYRQIKKDVYNDYETILMGYTDTLKNANGEYANHVELARWNDKDFTWNGTTKVYPQWSSPSATYDYVPYGVFEGLPAMGTKTAGGEVVRNWIRHDKFYYYMKPIGPGATVPNTDPLFFSYEIDQSPVFYIADNSGVRRPARDVHFVMDLMVQAIGVPVTAAGDTLSYLEAWTAALNPEDSPNYNPNFNINDL